MPIATLDRPREIPATANPPAPRDAPETPLNVTPGCRRGAVIRYNTITRVIIVTPARCRRWTCSYCAPRLRQAWSLKIAAAKPERFLTLTADPRRFPNPQAAADAMKAALPKLVAKLRKLCGSFEYAAIWESHESGYPHLHIAQRGVYVPQKLLRDIWHSLGIGEIVDIRAVTNRAGAAAYVAKYLTKEAATPDRPWSVGRPVQFSKRFLPAEQKVLAFPRSPFIVCAYTTRSCLEVVHRLRKGHSYAVAASNWTNGIELIPTVMEEALEDLSQFLFMLQVA